MKSVQQRLLDYYGANEVTGVFLFIRLSGSRFKAIYSRNQLSVTRPPRPQQNRNKRKVSMTGVGALLRRSQLQSLEIKFELLINSPVTN